jgi:hypothetical protein
MMKTTRSEFIQGALLACASGIAAAACGGEDDPGGEGNNGGSSGSEGACGTTIASNHGHKLTVTKAQAQAGGAKSYDIQGDSMHPHTVELTAAQMTALADGDSVTVESSEDADHSHSVTISCA